MKTFMGNNFLLNSDTAKALYHQIASKLPIIDYHCHVSPKEIADDKHYRNITELWLGADHYKWRAMRSCGIDERYVTGDASDYEKFRAFVCCMPRLIGNPLYHWSHLELKRYFGYNGALNSETADEVWALCNEKLASDELTARGIIKQSNVELICTTDDPCDTLEYHDIIAEDDSFDVRVLPAFRPDKYLNIDKKGWYELIGKLSSVSGIEITDIDSFKAALANRLDYFELHGCVEADHGLDEYVPFEMPFALHDENSTPSSIFTRALNGDKIYGDESDIFRTEILVFLAGEYYRRGWVMQIHFGVLRNVNTPVFKTLGADAGMDIIGGRNSTFELAKLLNRFSSNGTLPKTIIYSCNPSDNASVAALIGAFQNNNSGKFEPSLPNVMQGAAWWFNDNIDGMRAQLTTLANMSALGSFAGMLTDSRSFLSYTRHEYFRRILCNIIGEWVEKGEIFFDEDELSTLIADLCYNNTKRYLLN